MYPRTAHSQFVFLPFLSSFIPFRSRCQAASDSLFTVYWWVPWTLLRKPLLFPQVYQVKDERAARVHLVGLGTPGHQGGVGIQVPQDLLDLQDTVTRTLVWDTMSEVSIIHVFTDEIRLTLSQDRWPAVMWVCISIMGYFHRTNE